MELLFTRKGLKNIKYGLSAYTAWLAQKQRGKMFGLVFIRDKKKFILWYLQQIKNKDTWSKPSVSRINHKKGYSFKNILLEEMSSNLAERNSRYTRSVIVYKDGVEYKFKSIKEAAIFCEIPPNNISACCKNKGRKTLNGYSFKYGI